MGVGNCDRGGAATRARGLLPQPLQSLERLYTGTVEEPLKLVEYIVTNNLPFTDIVTADYMLTDDVTATMYGVPYDYVQSGWQVSEWPDAPGASGASYRSSSKSASWTIRAIAHSAGSDNS